MIKLALAGLGLAIILLVFTPVHGKDITTYQCVPASAMIQNTGDYTEATHDQLMFLRAGYVTQQNTPNDLPPGDKALMRRDGDNTKIVFIDGDLACASMMVYKSGTEALDQIKRGEINHAGKGT